MWIRVPLVDAIECMVYALGERRERLLLASTVDSAGLVGPGECFSLGPNQQLLPSPDVLFHVAQIDGAPAMLFGSKSHGPISELHPADLRLSAALLEAGRQAGVAVVDHVLVEGPCFRLMRESTDLWGRRG